jgi:hypothetical protein
MPEGQGSSKNNIIIIIEEVTSYLFFLNISREKVVQECVETIQAIEKG